MLEWGPIAGRSATDRESEGERITDQSSPPAKAERLLTATTRVRLTAAEGAALARLAAHCRTTRARLLRRAVREMVTSGPDLFEDGLVGLSEAARELAAVGRNLNQIAARLNSGDYAYPSDILGAVREVAATTGRLQAQYRSLVQSARQRWLPVATVESH